MNPALAQTDSLGTATSHGETWRGTGLGTEATALLLVDPTSDTLGYRAMPYRYTVSLFRIASYTV